MIIACYNTIKCFLQSLSNNYYLSRERAALLTLLKVCSIIGYTNGQNVSLSLQALSPYSYLREISQDGKYFTTMNGEVIDSKSGYIMYKVPDSLFTVPLSMVYIIDERHALVVNNSIQKIIIIDFIANKVNKILVNSFNVSVSVHRDYMVIYSSENYPIRDVTDSINNARIIKDQQDNVLQIFSLPDGKYISAINTDILLVHNMVLNKNKCVIIGIKKEGVAAILFDWTLGKEIWKKMLPQDFSVNSSVYFGSVKTLSITASGNYIVCNGMIKDKRPRLLILDSKDGTEIENMNIPGAAIVSPDDKYVLLLQLLPRQSDLIFSIQVIDFNTKKKMASLQLDGIKTHSISISPDFKEAILQSETPEKLLVLDLLALKLKRELKAPSGYYYLFSSYEENSVLYTNDNKYLIHIYKSDQHGKMIIGYWNRKIQKTTRKLTFRTNSYAVNLTYNSKSSEFFLSSLSNTEPTLFSIDFRNGFRYDKRKLNKKYFTWAFSPDYKLVGTIFNSHGVAGGNDLLVDSLESGKTIFVKKQKNADTYYNPISFDPKNKYFAYNVFSPGSNDVKIADLSTGSEILSIAKTIGISQYSSQNIFWSKKEKIVFVEISKDELQRANKICPFSKEDLNYSRGGLVKINMQTREAIDCYWYSGSDLSLSDNYIAFVYKSFTDEKNMDILMIINHDFQLIGRYPLPQFLGTNYKICFSPAEDYLLILPTLKLQNEENSGTIVWKFDINDRQFTRHFIYPYPISGTESYCINDNILISTTYGVVCFYDILNEKKLFTWQIFGPDDFIVTTPENYYYASKGTVNSLRFDNGHESLPYRQYELVYNRPEKVLEKIPQASIELIESYRKATQKRLQKMGYSEKDISADADMPLLRILTTDAPFETFQSSMQIAIQSEDFSCDLDRVNVWINDVPVYGSKGISLEGKKLRYWRDTLNLPLNIGENNIQFSTLNEKGIESQLSEMTVTCLKPDIKPDLYLISIGASEYYQKDMNLKYAAKDATDLVALFRSRSDNYTHIYTKTLLNQEVSLENIRKLRNWLNQCKTDDHVLIFLAGHGLLDSDLDYYLASYYIDFANPKINGIPYDLLDSLVDGIPARQKLILIDACHSGELDKENIKIIGGKSNSDGAIIFRSFDSRVVEKHMELHNSFELMKEIFVDLRRSSGATVISSSGGMEFAIEGDVWKNGVFTYSLIKGLREKEADLDQDGEIVVSELQDYLNEKVYNLTNGQQQPTFRIENITHDWRIW
jgi:uncharacterized protein YbaA (DUF1428 family)